MGATPRTLVAAEGWGQTQLEAPGHRSPDLSTFCPAGEGGLQSLLGNMSHSQLMQLIGPAGLGGLGNTPRAWEPLSNRVGQLAASSQLCLSRVCVLASLGRDLVCLRD